MKRCKKCGRKIVIKNCCGKVVSMKHHDLCSRCWNALLDKQQARVAYKKRAK